MFCCPVAKSFIALVGFGLLGYTGYESYSFYNKSGCCHKTVIAPATPAGTSGDECCSEDGVCSNNTSRAAVLAGQCPAGNNDACCEKEEAGSTTVPVTTTAAPLEGWATIKGQVVWGGDAIPKTEEFKVTSDQGHCLAKGPLLDKVWDVNPSNKGIAGIVVFINPERDQKLEVHPDLKAIPSAFVLDQPYCVFTPRVFAIRAGQVINAKNPDPVAHNVVVKGLRNDLNVQIPPGADKEIKLSAETNAMQVSCGSHPWMKGYGWCFDHPYFAVTDKDGNFEIKNVPAGSRKIVLWHETGYLPGYGKRDNKTLNLAPGGTADVGVVKAVGK